MNALRITLCSLLLLIATAPPLMAQGTSTQFDVPGTNFFDFNGTNGRSPGVIIVGADGNLYGVTSTGGSVCAFDCGTVFKIQPSSTGPWREKVLYNFTGGNDGNIPASLVMDKAGNLYGQPCTGAAMADRTVEVSWAAAWCSSSHPRRRGSG